MNKTELISTIADLPRGWHGCGTVDRNVLEAIANHAEQLPRLLRSVETGSGCTTLLFSHLSPNHTVFAVDDGESISQVRKSELFNSQTTTYIEGPTQRTLPSFQFVETHQLIMLDGPHAYPFPDLEYYFLYPTLDVGGLLIVDDVKIPSIRRMCEIIEKDDMFDLIDRVNDNTFFFRRTEAPTFNPFGDEWYLQKYNESFYKEILRAPSTSTLARCLRLIGPHVPQGIIRLMPKYVKNSILRVMYK